LPAKSGLTPRRARILAAIVEEYVETVAPVGSRAVRERHNIDASTATIRNEMGVLEREGYVRQPHTSAGRVPAEAGYRAYVNRLPEPPPPQTDRLGWVRREYRRAGTDVEDLYRTTSRVLSQLVSAPAMLMAPPATLITLGQLKLSAISPDIVLMEYELEPGGQFSCLLESPEALRAEQVRALGRALSERYVGRSVGAASLCSGANLQDDMAPHAVPLALLAEIKTALERDQIQRVYVDGAAYTLDFPEYRDTHALRPVVEALDEDRMVRRLLRPAARRGRLTVAIGEEIEVKRLGQCSVVARHYAAGRGDVGAVGVIGPTRMDYQTIMAAVNWVADQVAEALKPSEPEED
jgi:heat-inducible transcriptional repressor